MQIHLKGECLKEAWLLCILLELGCIGVCFPKSPCTGSQRALQCTDIQKGKGTSQAHGRTWPCPRGALLTGTCNVGVQKCEDLYRGYERNPLRPYDMEQGSASRTEALLG